MTLCIQNVGVDPCQMRHKKSRGTFRKFINPGSSSHPPNLVMNAETIGTTLLILQNGRDRHTFDHRLMRKAKALSKVLLILLISIQFASSSAPFNATSIHEIQILIFSTFDDDDASVQPTTISHLFSPTHCPFHKYFHFNSNFSLNRQKNIESRRLYFHTTTTSPTSTSHSSCI